MELERLAPRVEANLGEPEERENSAASPGTSARELPWWLKPEADEPEMDEPDATPQPAPPPPPRPTTTSCSFDFVPMQSWHLELDCSAR